MCLSRIITRDIGLLDEIKKSGDNVLNLNLYGNKPSRMLYYYLIHLLKRRLWLGDAKWSRKKNTFFNGKNFGLW